MIPGRKQHERSGHCSPLHPHDDGLAMFDCSGYREVEAGDHVIVILRLHAVEHADGAQAPLRLPVPAVCTRGWGRALT